MTASVKAYELADAVIEMTLLYGQARHRGAVAFSRELYATSDERRKAAGEESERWERAAHRRYMAIRRLTSALRDLDGAS